MGTATADRTRVRRCPDDPTRAKRCDPVRVQACGESAPHDARVLCSIVVAFPHDLIIGESECGPREVHHPGSIAGWAFGPNFNSVPVHGPISWRPASCAGLPPTGNDPPGFTDPICETFVNCNVDGPPSAICMRFRFENRTLNDGTTRRMMTGRAAWEVFHQRSTLPDNWETVIDMENGPCCINFCGAWEIDQIPMQYVDPRRFWGHRAFWVNQGEQEWESIGQFIVEVEMLDWNDESSTPPTITIQNFLAARKRVLYARATVARLRDGFVDITGPHFNPGGFWWSAVALSQSAATVFVPGAGECYANPPESQIWERYEDNPASVTSGWTEGGAGPEDCIACLSRVVDIGGPLENFNRVWPIDGPVLAARVIFS